MGYIKLTLLLGGYEVSNTRIQNQLDFINKIFFFQENQCTLGIDIVLGTFISLILGSINFKCQKSTFIKYRPFIYSATIIQGRKLFKGGNY